jgi:purine-binding chemotaxis protein CheW
MDAAARTLDEEFTPPPARRRAILEVRARALAAEPPAAPGPGFEVLEFQLANEQYALETNWVREVFPLREFTPLPGTPDFVLGIIHVRGRIVSVLDLKRFFELPAPGLSDLNKVIVVGDGAMEFGILADALIGVRRLAQEEVQAPLPTLTGIRADYLLGITRQRQVVLDGRRLLTNPALVVASEVAG